MSNSTDESSRLDGTLELNPDFEQHQPYGSLLPADFPKRLERLKEASGLTWSGLAAAIGVADVPVAQEGRAVRGSPARPLHVRSPVTRRPGDPHGRRVPADLLQELTGSPRLEPHGESRAETPPVSPPPSAPPAHLKTCNGRTAARQLAASTTQYERNQRTEPSYRARRIGRLAEPPHGLVHAPAAQDHL